MKKITALAIVAVMTVSSLTWAIEAPIAGKTSLTHGSVQTYAFGDTIIHAYITADPMSDMAYVIETPNNLIALESPAFDNTITEWKEYVVGLDKPLTDILLSYHTNGGRWFGNARTRATARAREAMTTGGTRQLINNLKQAFGDSFNDTVEVIDSVLPEGPTSIGGIDFLVTNDADGYDIAIPALGVVYFHTLGANVHSILVSPEHMDHTIAKLRGYLGGDYILVLSGHHSPETMADVESKIVYIARTKEIVAASADADDFKKRMQAEFPGYAGDNYLDMTAGALFN